LGRFGSLIDLIDTAKAFKSLKIRFESRTMVLTNVTNFGVVVGATVLTVKVEDKDGYQGSKYVY
jgi:hypothetical protein